MRYRALLVGVSDYLHLSRLEGPLRDVALVRRALTDRRTGLFAAADVEELINPTKAQFEERLSEFLIDRSRVDDLSLVYFAGHGKLTSERALCLCSSDTKDGRFVATGTIAAAVRSVVRDSKSSTVVLVLDCCHSGAYPERGTSSGILEEAARQLVPTPQRKSRGVFVLASARALQGAADVGALGRASPFAEVLARTLMESPMLADPFVTLDDVFDALDEELSSRGQFPQRISGEGVVVLARRTTPNSDVDDEATLLYEVPSRAHVEQLGPNDIEEAPESDEFLAPEHVVELSESDSDVWAFDSQGEPDPGEAVATVMRGNPSIQAMNEGCLPKRRS